MKRVMYVPNGIRGNDKYILCDEYEGFGIYQEKCPAGWFMSQSWLVYNGKTGFVCESFNNRCKEELMDYIDSYNETGKFGLHGYMAKVDENIFGVHPNNRQYAF